ncbi:MAG TPA: GGDEF domain-containing protein [Ensifer sp.]|nr:GGDEF domain-containing protein [Ensifer sp.]
MCAVIVSNPVTELMRRRKVPPLPRNYELFYEAVIGSNARLSSDLAALGIQPLQAQLDSLFDKYMGELRRNRQIDKAHNNLSVELSALLGLLGREKEELENHGASMTHLHKALGAKDDPALGQIVRAIAEVKTVTEKTLAANSNVMAEAENKSASLQEMRRKLNEYKRLAYIDSLTGLFNRRAFDDRMASAFAKYRKLGGCALILADIDHFKRFNDTYGHPVGDKVLTAVGHALAKFAGRNIFVARPGGEEFALIAENMSSEEAVRLAELVRQEVASINFEVKGGGAKIDPVTISLGVSMTDDALDGVEFYQNSDMALYTSKNAGRNRTTAYSMELRGALSNNRVMYTKAI